MNINNASSELRTVNILSNRVNHSKNHKINTNSNADIHSVAIRDVITDGGEALVKKKPITEPEIIKAIEKANKGLYGENARFEYSIHKETKQIMIKVIDSTNDEVIKEFPSEKILDMIAKLCELAGIFVDEKR